MSYRVFSTTSDAVYFGVTIYTCKSNIRSMFYACDDYLWDELFDDLKSAIKELASADGLHVIEIQVFLDGVFKGCVRADRLQQLFIAEEIEFMLEAVREHIRKLLTKHKKRQSRNWFSRLMGTKHAKENPPI